MKIIIEQSLEHDEVEIIIKCGLIDENLERLISQIRLHSFSMKGKKDGVSHIIRLEDVYYFESIDEKTFIYCEGEIYECNLKLYEIEAQLENTKFTRISKSCILNIMHLMNVRPMINGKFEAQLSNKEKVIVNRSYVPSFKQKFGL